MNPTTTIGSDSDSPSMAVGTSRSQRWFGSADVAGLIHRAYLKSEGFTTEAITGRPIIGICNSWSELTNCNAHLRTLAQAVKRGVMQAGGLPLEFPVISLSEPLMKPTAMLFRNLMAMDVEESIRANPMDAVVLLGGCDKTIPALLMGAVSVDVPAIVVTGGPRQPGVYCGRQISSGTDLWRFTEERRAGRMSAAEYAELETSLVPSVGHCSEMGTASTMSALIEALGLSLPGSALIPAVDARRYAFAEAAGRRAVGLATSSLRPSRLMTPEAFDNAIVLLMSLGGSTNAVIHLLALAGRSGVDLPLERFDEISRRTPMLTNIQPSGAYLVDKLFHAGGIPAVLKELAPLLHLEAQTVTGQTLGANIASATVLDRDAIGTLEKPWQAVGAIAILRGSLAPQGAVIKQTAAAPRLLRHEGRAVVFEDVDDLAARIDDPSLAVDASSVLVLRNAGPKGGPGMPEWGQLPIPSKLLRGGVTDMLRVSDARMSGTAFGTVVLHVAPESAAGGPLGVVRNGDRIILDVEQRRLDLAIAASELKARLDAYHPPPPKYRRGYGAMYLEHVLQADQGCDLDFLRKLPGEDFERDPLGIIGGPIGGW